LHGRVSTIQAEGHYDRISLALAGELSIDALITRDSTQRLELIPGTEVVALIKAGWLSLLAPQALALEGYNCLQARVEALLDAAQAPTEVRLTLSNGQTLCTFAEPAWLKAHAVKPGSDLRVQFQPSYVLIGTPL
jgi:molybdate transport system regulatory protein